MPSNFLKEIISRKASVIGSEMQWLPQSLMNPYEYMQVFLILCLTPAALLTFSPRPEKGEKDHWCWL